MNDSISKPQYRKYSMSEHSLINEVTVLSMSKKRLTVDYADTRGQTSTFAHLSAFFQRQLLFLFSCRDISVLLRRSVQLTAALVKFLGG